MLLISSEIDVKIQIHFSKLKIEYAVSQLIVQNLTFRQLRSDFSKNNVSTVIIEAHYITIS